MTLIYQRTGGGSVNKCDARCHNAVNPRCTCICGGRYHGKKESSSDLRDAVEQHSRELTSTLKEQGAQVRVLQQLPVMPQQLRLI